MADEMPLPDKHGEAGFTLLEVVAVLVIAALVTSAVIFTNRSSGGAARLKALSATVAAGLRHTRGRAIKTGREYVISVDTGNGRISWGTTRAPLTLGEGVRIKVISAESERRDRIAGIRFFPNGSSTGGRLQLSSSGTQFNVAVNWLTGHVSVDEAN